MNFGFGSFVPSFESRARGGRGGQRERETSVPGKAQDEVSFGVDRSTRDSFWLELRAGFIRIARRMTRSFDAEDVAQASILRFLLRSGAFQDPKLSPAYARQVVRSVIVDCVRAARRFPREEFPLEALAARRADEADPRRSNCGVRLDLLEHRLRASDRRFLETVRRASSVREAARDLAIQPQQLRRRIRAIACRIQSLLQGAHLRNQTIPPPLSTRQSSLPTDVVATNPFP